MFNRPISLLHPAAPLVLGLFVHNPRFFALAFCGGRNQPGLFHFLVFCFLFPFSGAYPEAFFGVWYSWACAYGTTASVGGQGMFIGWRNIYPEAKQRKLLGWVASVDTRLFYFQLFFSSSAGFFFCVSDLFMYAL